MITVKNFEVLSHLVNPPQEEEYAICTDTSEVYQYKNEEWHKVDKPDAKLNVSLYELNKTLYRSLSEISFNELQKDKVKIKEWIKDCGDEFFMLLCNERMDYTVFALTDTGAPAEQEIVDIVCERGIIKSIEINKEELWIQFWIETSKKEIYMYALFPYDNGVIKCLR